MQPLNITSGVAAKTIADKIITLLESSSTLIIHATGSEAINETISGIAIAKQSLKAKKQYLHIKPVVTEKQSQGDEITATKISFEIITQALFIKIEGVDTIDDIAATMS